MRKGTTAEELAMPNGCQVGRERSSSTRAYFDPSPQGRLQINRGGGSLAQDNEGGRGIPSWPGATGHSAKGGQQQQQQQQLTNCSVQRQIRVQRPVQQPMVKAAPSFPSLPPCPPGSSRRRRSPHPDRPSCAARLPQPALPFVSGSPSRGEGRRRGGQAGRRAKPPPPPTRLRPCARGGPGRRVGVGPGGEGRAARVSRRGEPMNGTHEW